MKMPIFLLSRISITTKTRRLIQIIGFIIVVFFIIWHYRVSVGSKQYSISTTTVQINEEFFRNFTFMRLEHARKLKDGFGRHIKIKQLDGSNECGDKSGCIVFNIVKPLFPKKIEFVTNNHSIPMASKRTTGFVRVLRYWEQLSMNVRALITLAGQAKFGNRKVQAPRVKNSKFGTNGGYSLGTYFNMTHFNHILTLGDYATLVGEEDYKAECSLADAGHVTIYFLYEYDEKSIKQNLKLNKKQYNEIRKKAGTIGWSECQTLGKENLRTKCFCVNVSKITDWVRLENKVIKGAKCLTVINWRGIGSSSKTYRTHFSDQYYKFRAKNVKFALKPSGVILKEANMFRRVLPGSYIAVHVRAEKIFTAHNLSRLLDCVRVLAELVKVLKVVSDITHVMIASDTSSFGSNSWTGQQKKNIHSFLVSSIGGIEYKPSADNVDRGVVALVEMTLLAHATHLITVGMGSFQEWVIAKFLEQHREDNQQQWSLITMCSK